ncbi:MAG: ABC transporter ATP-binding protein [Lentisphaerae bacterium]|jgi:ABC-2 type transport system ATP-binding protein|nr:ABC transporter ATP-binding protein [Lentisphaerota bacterium]MBT5609496.1 ABC transporter ATP-binding protein [Lentisphaerota bacterium]MBT7061644.1 ABC transporter ATP-binding protein [Lentisphaerota bacterium]MBT7846515.1 ABC transporter ATP-binding protein [Lentisphaerota bacterium]
MSQAAVKLSGIRKFYGSTRALDDFQVSVPAGVVCGLVGPNGAGKTTALGVMAGLVRADAGAIDLLGDGPFQARRHGGRITTLPQDCLLNAHAPVDTLLTYYGRLQGLSRQKAAQETDRVLDLVSLTDRRRARIGQLSHGMRRRVALAQALLGTPELVLLDEPTSGLDPHLVVQMRNVFLQQAKKSTVIISSHILGELGAMCDHVVIMEAGRCVRNGALDEVAGKGTLARIQLDKPPALDTLRSAAPALSLRWEGSTLSVQAPQDWSPQQINAALLPVLLDAGIGIIDVQIGQSLEETYLASRKNGDRH